MIYHVRQYLVMGLLTVIAVSCWFDIFFLDILHVLVTWPLVWCLGLVAFLLFISAPS